MGRTVAIVANSTWNLLNFRAGLIRAFAAAGDRVLLLAPDGPERSALAKLPAAFIPLTNLRRSGTNPVRDFALLRELTSIYRRESVTHALHFTIKPVIYGSLAARKTGVVNISTLTGLGFTFIAGGWTTRLVRTLYRYALKDAHRVFFHNTDDRALFLERGLCTPAQSAVVGGSGLPLRDFPLADYHLAEPGRILFAGRLLVDKGVRDYVAAARLVRQQRPGLSFHIVGPLDEGNPAGITRQELECWIAAGDIVYDGVATDIRPHLVAATLVVLPSYREGCPRVLLEAAATGRALIGTDVPGVRAVVRPENGLLVPREKPEELAVAVLKLMEEDLVRWNERASAGRRLVEEAFSEREVVGVYIGLVV